MQNQNLSCQCGAVKLNVIGKIMTSSDCECESCQTAGAKMEALEGAPKIVGPQGATHFELFRKDRVICQAGADHLAEFRLKEDSPTRRVVATCCNTPMFLDFGPGHWLSIYGHLWPEAAVPSKRGKSFSIGFMARLLWAWTMMGFKSPKINFVNRQMEL